ncbi:thiamine pyrophosphate-binding protein [Actinomadura rugatobispora]|uniref:Thiamine pyrophosphate-binding protein n=1 Tax=Actinomadura rugatobispora TaxID=1994 RepID=A0ABW0ZNK3_9ACTN
MQANRHVYSELAGRRRFADALVAALAGAGVSAVFGMPAESLNAFVDALRRDGRIRLVGVRHEGAGALMAATYGKLTGLPGVCMGTAGPGATHLPLGLYEAHADRAPLLAVSGQVPVEQVGLESFQEIDPVALMGEAALYNRHVAAPGQIGMVHRAMAEAALRRGPAHLAISSDVFAAPLRGAPEPVVRRPPAAGGAADKALLEQAADLLSGARTAVIVGAVPSDLAGDIDALAERIGAPVLVLPEGYRYFAAPHDDRALPVLQGRTADCARVLEGTDRLLLVGASSSAARGLAGGHPVLQVADGAERSHPGRPGWTRLLGDPAEILRQLRALSPASPDGDLAADVDGLRTEPSGLPFWEALDRSLPADAVVALEPGRMLDGAFGALPVRDRVLTSSYGLRVAGAALPAAIGASFAHPDRRVHAVTTDRGLQDFAAELLTLARYRLPVSLVCVEEDRRTDVRRLAAGGGLAAERAASVADLERLLAAPPDGPSVITVPADGLVEPAREEVTLTTPAAGSTRSVLAEVLAGLDVAAAYVRPGAGTEPLAALCRDAGITVHAVHHPESAAMTASAVAKHTGRLTLCLTAADADTVLQLNGLYDASFDHAPLAVLGPPGTVVDGTSLLADAARTLRVGDDPGAVAEAAHALGTAASEGRAVYLEIDPAVLDRPVRGPLPAPAPPAATAVLPGNTELDAAAARLAGARRPVILAGRGGRGAGAEIAELAGALGAPVVSTMPGRGVLPDHHPHYAGAVGSSGHQCATETLEAADVVVAFGVSRRGASAFDLPGGYFLVQVDHDLGRLGGAARADVALHGTARHTAQALAERIGTAAPPEAGRQAFVRARHDRFLATRRRRSRIPTRASSPIRPSALALALADELARGPAAPLITVDVGLTTLWIYRYLTGRQDFVWTSSFATMGFAVPAAAGIAAFTDRPVLAAAGDGGVAVTLGELATLRDLDRPVVVVVFDNGRLGAIKFEQEIMGWPEYGSALHNGDLAEIARGYGLAAERVTTMAGLRAALRVARLARRPYLIDVVCDDNEIPAPAQQRPAAAQIVGYALALAREARRGLSRSGGTTR